MHFYPYFSRLYSTAQLKLGLKCMHSVRVSSQLLVSVLFIAVPKILHLLPYKELLTSVVPGEDHKAAATSCFHIYCSWSFLLWWILVQTLLILIILMQMCLILLQRRLTQFPRRRIEVQARWILLQRHSTPPPKGQSQLQRWQIQWRSLKPGTNQTGPEF